MLYIGSDHAGYKTKQLLIEYFKKQNIDFVDMGTHSEESCHYPVIAKAVCEKIQDGDVGVLICGTGLGMSMCANKFYHIRAGLCVNQKQAKMSRKHNNANVLVLQGRDMSIEKNIGILQMFLKTKFDGGRHEERIKMFSKA